MRKEFTANIKVLRNEHTLEGATLEVEYCIGWGREGKIQGDSMTRTELETLYALIGKALEEHL
ncbi:MAG TPA: hypothetical protein H9779_03500 [Candidatus Alistipes avicola]|uniref:Uncharacterized protein n=1 Tax=Candidatus Alistipes avicola TaxID=2838432 RepID=A0A9D2L3Y0_9BACT|nr:hypothetical protein [uncultured Alistipes sp.]HJA98650.1 hypothetical protein [Candidatus Alistipes avicola]